MPDIIMRDSATGQLGLWRVGSNGELTLFAIGSPPTANWNIATVTDLSEPTYTNPTVTVTSADAANKKLVIASSATEVTRISQLDMYVRLSSIQSSPELRKRIVFWWKKAANFTRIQEYEVYRNGNMTAIDLLTDLGSKDGLLNLELGTELHISIEDAGNGVLGVNDSVVVWGQAMALPPMNPYVSFGR